MKNKNRVQRTVTLQDVAERAGVSPKTVSNVVNDWPYISEETRSKVQVAIAELGYRPSGLARSLVTGRTDTIGVVLPDISNPFFGQVVRGCEDVLHAAGYNIFLCNTDEDSAKEEGHLNTLVSRGVDALLVWGSRMEPERLSRLIGDKLPTVTIDCVACGSNSTCLDVDNIGGAQLATEHLVARGRRRIAHLAGPAQRLTAQRRLTGYQQALGAAGLPWEPSLVMEAPPSIRGGYLAALELLPSQRPDALFCYNDLMAVGALVACRQIGMSVPGELAVVGFDDIVISMLVTPPLTTVRIAQYDLGRTAAELLLGRLAGKDTISRSVLFPVQLQVRNSCGARRLSRKETQEMLTLLVTSVAVDLPATASGREGRTTTAARPQRVVVTGHEDESKGGVITE